MKILHILQSSFFSGAENVVCQMIQIMSEDVDMIYSSPKGSIEQTLLEKKINYSGIEKLSVREVKRIIKVTKPDIIPAHDMRASFIAALACGKIPLICHIHNNSFDSRKLNIKTVLFYFAAEKAKHIFWVSDSCYDKFIFSKQFKNKSSVLYNIMDLEMLYSKMRQDKNEYKFDIVYLGRLTYPKNPKRLIAVLEKVIEKMPNIKIAIIGTGDMEDEVKELVSQKMLNDNISFLGYRENPYKILYDAQLMIMTSFWEGLPMCALEAMGLGVPIVSTPTDGLCKLILNGETGYLKESDDELATACMDIIGNSELRKKLSDASIERSIDLMDKEIYRKNVMRVYTKSI